MADIRLGNKSILANHKALMVIIRKLFRCNCDVCRDTMSVSRQNVYSLHV